MFSNSQGACVGTAPGEDREHSSSGIDRLVTGIVVFPRR